MSVPIDLSSFTELADARQSEEDARASKERALVTLVTTLQGAAQSVLDRVRNESWMTYRPTTIRVTTDGQKSVQVVLTGLYDHHGVRTPSHAFYGSPECFPLFRQELEKACPLPGVRWEVTIDPSYWIPDADSSYDD